jgi:uncharacterized protein
MTFLLPAIPLLTLTALGQYFLTRALLSKLHAHPLPHHIWRSLVAAILTLSIAAPLWMLSAIGLHGPRLLTTETNWSHIPLPWWLYITACSLAAITGLTQVQIQRRRTDPPTQTALSITLHNSAQSLPHPPRGKGLPALASHIPGNEIFHLHIIHRQLKLPTPPKLATPLRILHLSDLHFNGTPDLPYFQKAIDLANDLNPDLIALTGDILDTQRVAHWFAPTLGKLRAPLGRYFVLGNHDMDASPDTTRHLLTQLGWTDVSGRCLTRCLTLTPDTTNHPLHIGGTERPWHGHDPTFPAPHQPGLRLLLAHGPDPAIHNRFPNADLILAGHLHGGQICLPLLGPIKSAPYLSGIYQHQNTLLHMSRGLGEMTPLRYGCPPEITLLTLE